MKIMGSLIGVMLLFMLIGCGDVTKSRNDAKLAIEHFHVLYNAGEFDSIWNAADTRLRDAGPKEKYDQFMAAVMRKLSKETASEEVTWTVSKTFGNGTFFTSVQKSTFEQGQASESFRFIVRGDSLVLLNYNIQSNDLIIK